MNANEILDEMEKIFPDAKCELYHESPFQLIVAVVLSAQTTDAMVNKVTPALFKAYPTAEKMAKANVSELEPYIKRIGLYRNKARSISNLSKDLVERYHGQVPYTYKDLMSLAGVGRKTANVVRSVAFDIPSFAVDTHVNRVSKRLGLAKYNDSVEKVEEKLKRKSIVQDGIKVIMTLYFLGVIFVIQEIQNVKDVLLKAFVRKINMRNNSTTLVVFSFCIVIKDKIIKLTNSW